MAIRWPAKIKAGTVINSFINFVDFAPSFLESAGLESEGMSGESFWEVLQGNKEGKSEVFLERERHANVRKGDQSYPMRAIRNHQYLYIWNPMPERMPAGAPSVHQSVGQFGDVDHSITKFLVMQMKEKSKVGQPDYYELNFGQRPEVELYDVISDPFQLNNLADKPELSQIQSQLREQLHSWMEKTGDLRAKEPRTLYWDQVRYTPDYQMKDADIPELIRQYRIFPPFGPDSQKGIPCTEN